MSDVLVYSSDHCGFCDRAKGLLQRKGVPYREVEISRSDMGARMKLVELTGRYTVPQILIDGQPIGGFDELRALERSGELDALLNGVAAAESPPAVRAPARPGGPGASRRSG